MRKLIDFGKIAYYGKRRINSVDVEIELRERGGEPIFTIDPQTKMRNYTGEETERYLEFSACGSIWNGRHTDIICGGQCLDEIADFIRDPLFTEIHKFWKLYHLNGMHAGTEEQENALAVLHEWQTKNGVRPSYDNDCAYLETVGLYEVEYNGKLYRYGSAWLHRDIPAADLERIKEIIGGEC